MTAPGVPTSGTVEVEFTAGVWTDVSAYVALELGITRRIGRATPTDSLAPGTFTCVLRNDDGRFTPDNALSPYFPNVVEGKRVRWKVTKGATYSRFQGRISEWLPDFAGGELLNATVTVNAEDVLGDLARRPLQSDVIEQCLFANSSCDLWPLAEESSGTSARNVGLGSTQAATVVPAKGNVGSSSFGQPFDGTLLDGSWQTTVAASTRSGPVLVCPLQGTAKSIEFSFRVDETVPVTGAYLYNVATFYDANGQLLFRLMTAGDTKGTYQFVTTADELVHQIEAAGAEANRAQGVPYFVQLIADGSGFAIWAVSDNITGANFTGTGGVPFASIAKVVLGGYSRPYVSGKQASGWNATYGPVLVQYTVATPTYQYALSSTVVNGFQRAVDVFDYYGNLAALSTSGTDYRTVKRKPNSGRSVFDVLAELTLTVGADCYADGTGLVKVVYPDAARSLTAVATLALESDDDSSTALTWRRAFTTKPTRVTATCPDGSITMIDAAAETAAGGTQRAVSVDTCAASLPLAGVVASGILNRGYKLQPAQLAVDVANALNDLYATVMTVVPGSRLRSTNVPSSHFGITQVDAYVMGWSETLDTDSYRFVFDMVQADAPSEGRFDTMRFATNGTSTLNAGITNSGTTVVIATASGPTFSTTPGDYPLDIDLNGERVTLTSAPGGAASPQTFTGVTRGVSPTVARAHSGGEAIEVWDAIRFAQ